MKVIKENKILTDDWQYVDLAEDKAKLPEGKIVVPFTYWQQYKTQLLDREEAVSISINGDDLVEDVAKELQYFDLIVLEFPKFTDGRNYSHARLLRERYGYTGELRAVGNVLRDQLFNMKRCGINSFQIDENKDIEEALKGLSGFSVSYQAAADETVPVSKNR